MFKNCHKPKFEEHQKTAIHEEIMQSGICVEGKVVTNRSGMK